MNRKMNSGVRGLEHQALNEYVCMRLAALCGIRSAHVSYREFEGAHGLEPAIVIERYDRKWDNEKVARLHQEDFCQALGCLLEIDQRSLRRGRPGDAARRNAVAGGYVGVEPAGSECQRHAGT